MNVSVERRVVRGTAIYRVRLLELGRRGLLQQRTFLTPRAAAEWALDRGHAIDSAQIIRLEEARGLR